MGAADKFKKKRNIIAPTAEEKEKAIEQLFNSLPTSVPNLDKLTEVEEKIDPPRSGGIEIYSTFGFGSIVVDGHDTKLPYRVYDSVKLMQLKAQYPIDRPGF